MLIPYADWSRRARGATRDSHPIGATRGVTLHWEGPHMGAFAHSECPSKVRGIQDFHINGRGWADIAYNAVVCPHGYIFEGRGPGVTSAANGNESTNDDWYAVCYLGGERDPFTDDGKAAFIEAVAWLREEGDAGPEVNGHRDHKATECPGNEIYTWLHGRDWNQEDDMFEPKDRKLLEEIKASIDELEKDEADRAAAAAARERRLFQNLRVILKERFGATDADLDDIRRELGVED